MVSAGAEKTKSARSQGIFRLMEKSELLEVWAYDYGCNSGFPSAQPTQLIRSTACMQEDPACNEPGIQDRSYLLISWLLPHAQERWLYSSPTKP